MTHPKFHRQTQRKFQHGIMLIEGLIAILIFSLGILALVGMQATAIGHTSQAKYRADAAFLANKLIGQMWADAPGNRTDYATGGTRYNTWKTQEVDTYLPAGGRSTAVVTVATFAATRLNQPAAPAVTGYRVTIQIQWRAPNEDSSVPAHTYQTTTEIIS